MASHDVAMTTPIILNTNVSIRCRLTKEGIAQLLKHMYDPDGWAFHPGTYVPMHDEDFTCKLWEFMACFGPMMYPGGQPMTVNNTITIIP